MLIDRGFLILYPKPHYTQMIIDLFADWYNIFSCIFPYTLNNSQNMVLSF